MKTITVPKENLISSMDIQVVPWDYAAKKGEYTYVGYLGGDIPVLLMSHTITEYEFKQMC